MRKHYPITNHKRLNSNSYRPLIEPPLPSTVLPIFGRKRFLNLTGLFQTSDDALEVPRRCDARNERSKAIWFCSAALQSGLLTLSSNSFKYKVEFVGNIAP